jgi:hypothetical protein
MPPAEDQIGMFLLQGGPKWSITDDDKLDRVAASLHGTIRCYGGPEIFLWRNSPYIQHDQPCMRYAPTGPQFGTTTFRGEQPTIDSSIEKMDILEANGLQSIAEIVAWDQCAVGTVMKVTKIAHDHRLQPAPTIIFRVAVEVGMKATPLTSGG